MRMVYLQFGMVSIRKLAAILQIGAYSEIAFSSVFHEIQSRFNHFINNNIYRLLPFIHSANIQ